MIEITLASIALVAGLILIIISSDKVVIHVSHLARVLGISPLIIGVIVVSIGTDLSEIFNSLISCLLGHANISAGDSIGSILVLLTLIIGILPFLAGTFQVERKEILVLGACEILALIMLLFTIEKGYFTSLNALFLAGSVVLYFLIIYLTSKEDFIEKISKFEIKEIERSKKYHALIAGIGFIVISISAVLIVESVIVISTALKVNEFIISFFLVAIGTSLPELIVEISALRRKEIKLAVGDMIGSCIVNATLAIGVGQIFFPQVISSNVAIPSIFYTIFASLVIFIIMVSRKKVDKKAGAVFILLYVFSIIFILVIESNVLFISN